MPSVPTASEMYALAEGNPCRGKESCHWCGAPCPDLWPHDDPPANTPFVKVSANRVFAKNRNGRFVCAGCRLFRRMSTTVTFLGGGLKDRQHPPNHSWIMMGGRNFGLDVGSYLKLWEVLTAPPKSFCLAFREGNGPNHIQLFTVNGNGEVKADTPLTFTVNGIEHQFTVHELEQGRKLGLKDLVGMGGSQFLLKLLIPHLPPLPVKENTGGRPTLEKGVANPSHRPVTGKAR